jgi:tetratricopeptide (TPR) repeat protein
MSCRYEEALKTLEPILLASEKDQDPEIYPLALGGAGSILFYLGDLLRARDHMVRCIGTNERLKKLPTVWSTGVEPALGGRLFAGWNLWLLGYPDQAQRSADEAIALSGRLASSPYTVLVHYLAAQVALANGDYQRACDLAGEITSRSTNDGFQDYVFLGVLILKMAKAQLGDESALRDFLDLLQRIGPRLFNGVTSIYAAAAEFCLRVGRTDEGNETVEKALAIVNSNHEGFYEAEVHRLKGELRLRLAPRNQGDDVAEQCFLRALSVAGRQGAKSLELRTAMSIARLRRDQGRFADAHRVLSQTLGWFTEGFDTRDLTDAKSLLDELNSESGNQQAK